MNTVKMVAKLGDQQIPVGTCNSAQARILVRDDLAAWQDGALLLFIRRAHLALLDQNPHLWLCPKDDSNTSQAELDRRKAWFLQFIPRAAEALSTPKRESERDLIHEEALKMVGGFVSRHGPFESTVPPAMRVPLSKAGSQDDFDIVEKAAAAFEGGVPEKEPDFVIDLEGPPLSEEMEEVLAKADQAHKEILGDSKELQSLWDKDPDVRWAFEGDSLWRTALKREAEAKEKGTLEEDPEDEFEGPEVAEEPATGTAFVFDDSPWDEEAILPGAVPEDPEIHLSTDKIEEMDPYIVETLPANFVLGPRRHKAS